MALDSREHGEPRSAIQRREFSIAVDPGLVDAGKKKRRPDYQAPAQMDRQIGRIQNLTSGCKPGYHRG
ncbi:hypothetical protein [Ktedonobacter sp. SOSP1-52]|uniref:hypothetical protein n=1 Tax=Ktedonobacter sp. SOSP1-52 TaxID=2778366 RepID=UPI0019157250|nr:hypothetical protein [Ktedonobacter sp. SOSP1-52]